VVSLEDWGIRLAKRIGTEATVVEAGKLAGILRRMLSDGSEFPGL